MPEEPRPLELSDIPWAVELLAGAFFADPGYVHALQDAGARPDQLRWIFRRLLPITIPHAASLADPGEGALATWVPPEASPILGALRLLRHGVLGAPCVMPPGAIRRLLAMGRVVDRRHRALGGTPHWYLDLLAAHPERQGQGLGSGLLRAGLARVDARALPAYLLTSKPANLDYYRRFGFAIHEEGPCAPGGPPLWTLVRPARGARTTSCGVDA